MNRFKTPFLLIFLIVCIVLPQAALAAPDTEASPAPSASSAESAPQAALDAPDIEASPAPDDSSDEEEPPAASGSPAPDDASNQTDSEGRPALPDREAAILIDLNTSTILYDKNSDKRMYPASTTKMMTALLVLEAVDSAAVGLEDGVTVSADMLAGPPADGSSMNLKEGEEVTIQMLLEGLLLASGNDAARTLAFVISGSEEAFVDLMNARAEELGLTNTHFANPHGLSDPEHYTTATDLAVIAREAMQFDTFREIVEIAHIKIPPTNLSEERYFINTNGLLSTMRYLDYYYEPAIGVKTGYTSEAGNCLVAAAQKGGMTLLSVVLNGAEVKNSHNDTIRLFEYGFSHYKTAAALPKEEMVGEVRVKQGAGGVDYVTLSTAEDVLVTIPQDVNVEDLTVTVDAPEAVYAPVQAGAPLATVTVSYEGTELGSADLLADASIDRHPLGFLMSAWEALWGARLFRIVVYLLLAALAVFLIVLVIGIRRELKRANRYKRHR